MLLYDVLVVEASWCTILKTVQNQFRGVKSIEKLEAMIGLLGR